MYRLLLFGSAAIEGPTGPLTGRPVQRRRLALLALLAGARGRGVARERLIALLWPDANPDRARAMLSDSVYRINQAVGGEAIVAVADELRLNTERLPCDACAFADAIAAGDWRHAVALQAAPFLDGFILTGADEFERWVDLERTHLTREKGRALEALVTEAEAADAATAAEWARLLAIHDPFSSRNALRYMVALERAGERATALRHAQVHAQLVRAELGVEPDEAITDYAARLRSAPPPSAPAAAADPERPSMALAAPEVPAGSAASLAGPPEASPQAPTAPPAPRRRRRLWVAPLAIAGALIASLVVLARTAGTARSADAATALAVLPFADLSPAGDHAYLADGITEELIVRLARLDGMRVVGRTSAFALRNSTHDVREIADRLGVDVVLAGSVRRAGSRVRIVAQLVDAGSGYQLWTETYEREVADVFAIQDGIARAIVMRLRGGVSRTDSSRLAVIDTDDPEAYNLYLRGRYEWHRRTEQGLRDAVDYFQRATRRAPSYARAWVGLGDAYAVLGFYDYLPPDEAFPRAADAARSALRLRADLAEAHATLGYVALYHDFDWALAEAEFRRAIELDPGYSTGRQWYANFLTATGRFADAEREMRIAQQLDPLSLIANAALGWVLYYAGDHAGAIAQCTHTLELDPDFQLAYLWRGMALEATGAYHEAVRDMARAVELSDSSAISVAALARAYALAGDSARARSLVRTLDAPTVDHVPYYEVAKVHAALGDVAAALDLLARARAQRSHSLAFLAVDPQLAVLRGEARYRALVQDMKFD